MASILENALRLRRAGKNEEALALLRALLAATPGNAQILFHTASVLDGLGREAEAVPLYVAAMTNGLSGAELRAAYVGLGSSYRVLGKYDESKRVLEEGLQKFPQAHEIRVFLAMTLHSLQQDPESTSRLLQVIADTATDAQVKAYEPAIRFYAENLLRQANRGPGTADGKRVTGKDRPGKISARKKPDSCR